MTVAEGQLRLPVVVKITKARKPRTDTPNQKQPTGEVAARFAVTMPGFTESKQRKRLEDLKLMPAGSWGNPGGVSPGMTKEKVMQRRNKIRDALGVGDIDEMLTLIRARLDQEECPMVRLCMADNAEIILTSLSANERGTAKRDLMAYIKAKPMTKVVENTTATAEEAWNQPLDMDELTPGKDICQPRPN